MSPVDHLAAIHIESARFHQCLSGADPAAPVPSCPDWTSADLLWHLTEVQIFWCTVVRERWQTEPELDQQRPAVDYAGLLSGFTDASEALVNALQDTSDEVPVWTWADNRSVKFIRRRQAHEALIHRLDAEMTVGTITALPTVLADDGVDEALRIMFDGCPDWADYQAGTGRGRIVCTDTGSRWDLTIGRWSGTSPASGRTYDEPAFTVSIDPLAGEPDFTIAGPAGELDAWLWGRHAFPDPVVTGHQRVAAAFLAVVDAGIS